MDFHTVAKHSATIASSGVISSIARRAYNIMLWRAQGTIGERGKIHEVSIAQFLSDLRIQTKNMDWLQSACQELMTVPVRWDIRGKDRKIGWGMTTLLAEAWVRDGYVRYAYSPSMCDWLSIRRMYAKISLKVQSKFSGKYSLILYELCQDYRGVRSTGLIAEDDLREIFGVTNKYPKFNIFNSYVLKPALKEVNDPFIGTGIRVTMKKMSKNRRVVGVTFLIEEIMIKEQREGRLVVDVDPHPSCSRGALIARREAEERNIADIRGDRAQRWYDGLPADEQKKILDHWLDTEAAIFKTFDREGVAFKAAFRNYLFKFSEDKELSSPKFCCTQAHQVPLFKEFRKT